MGYTWMCKKRLIIGMAPANEVPQCLLWRSWKAGGVTQTESEHLRI
jgi:hypothetical protein